MRTNYFALVFGILFIIGGFGLLDYSINISTTTDYGIGSVINSMYVICGIYFFTGILMVSVFFFNRKKTKV